MNLNVLKAAVKSAEASLANARAKSRDPNLSDTTRRTYEKQTPILQRQVLEARKLYNDFIDEQREERGFKPREYVEVKHIRRH